jgi:hypothetical protein
MSRLDEIEARTAAATPGNCTYDEDCGFVLAENGAILAQTWSKQEYDYPNASGNGKLYAHAPADLRALLDVARKAALFLSKWNEDDRSETGMSKEEFEAGEELADALDRLEAPNG